DWPRWGCTATQLAAWGLEHLTHVERLFGRTPVVYTYRWFWTHVLPSASPEQRAAYARYHLWMADYTMYLGKVPTEGAAPFVPAPWSRWTLWQHDGNEGLRLPSGRDADFDVFNGDEAAWRAFLRADVDVTDGGRNRPIYVAPAPG